MAFLAPVFLALAAMVGVPLLVHFLRRKAGKSFDFPAVRYLLRMEQEHHRDVQLRNRILLLLRLVAVVALALAAARPIARLIGTGHAPVAMAVVIDNSMSSGVVRDGHQVLSDLRAAASQLLASLDDSDRAWIITADGSVTGGSSQVLRDRVAALMPLGGRGDLGFAMRRAIELSRSGAPRTAVVAMATDGQVSSMRTDSVAQALKVPVVVFAPPSGQVVNRAVIDVSVEPVRWTPGGTASFSIASPDSAQWRVTLDGRTVARGVVPPAPFNAPAHVSQRLASAGKGWVAGSVELEPDALRADNTRYFAVLLAPPPTVDVRKEAGVFLDAAFATLVNEKRVVRAGAATQPVTISSAEAPGLRLPVLLVAPRDPLLVGEANRRLGEMGIPWRFGAISHERILARAHFKGFADSTTAAQGALNGTAVYAHYPLVYSPGKGEGGMEGASKVDTLATVGATGAPWIVAGEGYVLIGSAIDPETTELPLRAAFLPWLSEILARRLGGEETLVHAAPGSVLNGFRADETIESSDGKAISIAGGQLTLPVQSGVYFITTHGKRSGVIVANGESEESDFSPAQGRGEADSSGRTSNAAPSIVSSGTSSSGGQLLSNLVHGRDISVLETSSAWRDAVFARALGRSLLIPLLLLALAALIAESWISGRRQ